MGQFDFYFADVVLRRADGAIIPIWTGNAAASSLTATVSGPGTATSVSLSVGPPPGSNAGATGTHYYLADQLGTTQMELSNGGWPLWIGQFSPFGQELETGSTSMHYKFTGKERDAESGLDYFGARYYGSAMGRFTSPDDGSDQDPSDPQSWNLYSYVQNNPIRNVDPDGHDCVTQTATSGGGETATVQTGGCSGAAGNGTTQTYIAGTVTSLSYASNGQSLNVGYNAYGSDPDTSASVSSLDRAPAPDNPGIAVGYQQGGFNQLNNTANVVNRIGGAIFNAETFFMGGLLGETAPETGLLSDVGKTRVSINWAHQLLDVRPGHLPPPGTQAEVQQAVSSALNAGRYSTNGSGVISGTTTIHGVEVGFSGKMVNGVARIATVFTKR